MDLWNNRTGVLSVQVLQEFYVTVTRKLVNPLSTKEARNIIRNYLNWPIEINDSLSVLNASRIEENYKLSFWDALIVAAASKANVSKILTEDLKSGQVIEGILIENPFLNST
jgi:predicted nucleic acid-binding protein